MGKIQVKPWIVNIAKKLLIELSNVPQMCLKLLQKEQFKKTVEAACDLISNRMYDKITKVWKDSHNNNSETIRNEDDKEICNETYIFLEERQ